MLEDVTVPEGHVQLCSPRGGLLNVRIGSTDETDLREQGWKTPLEVLEEAFAAFEQDTGKKVFGAVDEWEVWARLNPAALRGLAPAVALQYFAQQQT